jgi:hypothetical protein
MEQLLNNIPHAPHTRQNDAPLLVYIAPPMVLSGLVAVAMSAIPAREPTKTSKPGRPQTLARGPRPAGAGLWGYPASQAAHRAARTGGPD